MKEEFKAQNRISEANIKRSVCLSVCVSVSVMPIAPVRPFCDAHTHVFPFPGEERENRMVIIIGLDVRKWNRSMGGMIDDHEERKKRIQ